MVRRRITQSLGRRAYTADGVDRYGNPVAGWAVPVPFPVYAVSPKQSVEEDMVGRRPIISGFTVYAPPGSVVGARDRFVVNGVEWDVEGEPGGWAANPHGVLHEHEGVQFDLKRVEG